MVSIDRSMRCSTNPGLTPIHTTSSDIVNVILYEPCVLAAHDGVFSSVFLKFGNLKRESKNRFGASKNMTLFEKKFHMLDQVARDVARYGNLNLSDASQLEQIM